MPRIRTDDEIYQQKMYYRGPEGMTMPFDVTYPQLFFGAFVIGGCDILAAVIFTPWAIFPATVVGVWITWFVSQKVTPDRPIRKVLRTAVTDGHRSPETPAATTVALSVRHLTRTDSTTNHTRPATTPALTRNGEQR